MSSDLSLLHPDLFSDGSVQTSSGSVVNYSFKTDAGTKITPSSTNLAKATVLVAETSNLNSEIDTHIQMAQMMRIPSQLLAKVGATVGHIQVGLILLRMDCIMLMVILEEFALCLEVGVFWRGLLLHQL